MPICRRGALALALRVALVAVVTGPLSAATEDPDPDFSLENTVQAGPFHLAPFFVIKNFGYDNNVRLVAEERTGDYTMTLGPGVRAIIPFSRRAALAVREEIDYAYFARDTDLSHVNNQIRAKLHVYLRDITLFTDGQQDSIRDRPNNEIDFRIRSTITAGKFGMTYRPSDRGQVDLYLSKIGLRYDSGSVDTAGVSDPNTDPDELGDLIATSLERDESIVGATGRLRIRPRTSLLFDLRTGRIDFDNAVPERDSSTNTMMAGLEFDPSGSVKGFIKAGYRHLSPVDDSVFDGYSGLIADMALSARVFGRGEVRATYLHDTGFSILGDNLYYILDQRGLSYEHFINSRLSLEPGLELQDIKYPVSFGPQVFRNDDIRTTQVTVRYRLGPSLRLGLTVGRWRRDSTFDNEDATRSTITTLVEYTP